MRGCPGYPEKQLYATGDDMLSSSKIKSAFPTPTSCAGVSSGLSSLNEGLSYVIAKEKNGTFIEKLKP